MAEKYPDRVRVLPDCSLSKFDQITFLPVDKNGLVNPQDVKNAIVPGDLLNIYLSRGLGETVLVSVIGVHNEIGVIQVGRV